MPVIDERQTGMSDLLSVLQGMFSTELVFTIPAEETVHRSFIRHLGGCVLVITILTATWAADDGAVPVLDTAGFWRMHYTLRLPVYLKDGEVTPMPLVWHGGPRNYAAQPTPLPPVGWERRDFDDRDWLRQPGLTYASVEENTDRKSAYMAHLALRGKFGVKDPARARGLTLDVEYRGGIVVYLNGEEVARQHLAKDATADTLAQPTQPGEKHPRTLTCTLPTVHLRKGANVLAVAVHRAPLLESEVNFHLTKWPQGVNIRRSTCAVECIRLSAPKSAADAVTPNVSRPKGFQVWNSNPVAADFDLDWGDPFEDLGPIRLVGARNGAFSGKVVAGSDGPIKGLRATVTDLSAATGRGRIPPGAIEVRYARPGEPESGANARYLAAVNRFRALDEHPPDEVPVAVKQKVPVRKGRDNPWHTLESPDLEPTFGAACPVWVTVTVPKDTPPGDYRGTLTVTATGEKTVNVPVELTVCPWTLPDPRDWHTFAEVVQSPETLALAYDVPLWSDEHFRLIDRSLRLTAQSGMPSVYVPLICETNLGNAETMVRWIRNPDGTYRHDFTPMERYLDLVEKHRGKPQVVCFWMWDTFLERTLGGRGDEKWNAGDVVKALKDAKGHGPDVTLLDPKTGKTSKMELPLYIDPKSETMWRPLADELMQRMKKRGWSDVAMLGCMCDYQPSKPAQANLARLFPGMKWVSHAHQLPRKDLEVGCAAVVFASYREYRDPVDGRRHGWKLPELELEFPRPLRNWFQIAQFRLVNEINIASLFRGSARFGGDYFQVLADRRGRLQGTIAGRFPKSHWHNLRIEVNFLEKGPGGAVSTADYEMFREGVQECEARIFVERALTDKALRAKLGDETAARLQAVLDERARAARSGAGTFVQSGHYAQHHTAAYSWVQHPGIIGGQWFVHSGWQDRSKALFTAADEVATKLGAMN